MRILFGFFKILFILGFIGSIAVVFVGQLFLFYSGNEVVKTIETIESFIRFPATAHTTCQKAPQSSGHSQALAIQLRFLDDHSYVVELLCTQIESFPQKIASGMLPRFVQKTPGSSGLYYALGYPRPTTFTLQSFFAKKTYALDSALYGETKQSIDVTKPETSCAGYGYRCCDTIIERGVGASAKSGVTDCPLTCFAACVPRPHFIQFSAEPYPNSSREIEMQGEQLPVTFLYEAQELGGSIDRVRIEYGDGESQELGTAAGTFLHTYTCASQCKYSVRIVAYNTAGNSSLASDLTTLYIVRR